MIDPETKESILGALVLIVVVIFLVWLLKRALSLLLTHWIIATVSLILLAVVGFLLVLFLKSE